MNQLLISILLKRGKNLVGTVKKKTHKALLHTVLKTDMFPAKNYYHPLTD